MKFFLHLKINYIKQLFKIWMSRCYMIPNLLFPANVIHISSSSCERELSMISDSNSYGLRQSDNPINQHFRTAVSIHLCFQHANTETYWPIYSVIINCGEQVAGFLWLVAARGGRRGRGSILGRAFKVRKSRGNSRYLKSISTWKITSSYSLPRRKTLEFSREVYKISRDIIGSKIWRESMKRKSTKAKKKEILIIILLNILLVYRLILIWETLLIN